MKTLKQNEDFIILREDEVLPPSTMDDVRGGLAMMGTCNCYHSVYTVICPDKDSCNELTPCSHFPSCETLSCLGDYIPEPAD